MTSEKHNAVNTFVVYEEVSYDFIADMGPLNTRRHSAAPAAVGRVLVATFRVLAGYW